MSAEDIYIGWIEDQRITERIDPVNYAVWMVLASANDLATQAKKRPLTDEEKRDCERSAELLRGLSE